ncbi:ATP-dependent RNA helicase HrpA, partial [Caballeronia sp.]|uniref:ATP-dependent RNA helicase HrpA n=1 Tax=Caballeronia sp. TaxID=1931223 RepID=UPI003C329A21
MGPRTDVRPPQGAKNVREDVVPQAGKVNTVRDDVAPPARKVAMEPPDRAQRPGVDRGISDPGSLDSPKQTQVPERGRNVERVARDNAQRSSGTRGGQQERSVQTAGRREDRGSVRHQPGSSSSSAQSPRPAAAPGNGSRDERNSDRPVVRPASQRPRTERSPATQAHGERASPATQAHAEAASPSAQTHAETASSSTQARAETASSSSQVHAKSASPATRTHVKPVSPATHAPRETAKTQPRSRPQPVGSASADPRPPRPRRVVEANPIPPIKFPEALPVSARREEIAAAIQSNQVVIVSGETGSGKTTQLPKICLSLGRGLGAGGSGLIGHTQPRRIAASATGRRIAEELGTPFGEVVGYKVRFTDNLSPGASVKLMTDGILLAETQTDPLLAAYDTIIIDEAHERSLNIDFLLGYLREILPRRPDLKVIVTSATIDADRFARHFGSDEKPAPVIEVSGRLYPVEVRYRPVVEESPAVKAAQGAPAPQKDRPDRPRTQRENDRDLMEAIVDAVDELCREGPGDVLVFLPGEREIRDAAEALRKHHPPHTEILPLFARLSAADQERVFRSSNARRIVLATNVAETSLTVPGIRYVVDTGLARVKRYSYRNKVEQLQIEAISQSSANQRAGRCGRVADGVCIRLYEEDDYNLRVRFTDPEILRSSLAAVILRMKSLHLTAIETFPFLEPPPGRAIADGYQLLNELGAVDDDNALTPLGRELARLPLDPRVGRMILAARDHQSLREVLII